MLKWLSLPENKRYYDFYKTFRFYEPTMKFDLNKEQVLTLGGEKVEIYFPGPTHTYDNTVVYIPGKKILFGGCMVLSLEAKKPGFVDDGNLTEWPKSLRKVLKKYSDAELVIPGHGRGGDISLLNHSISVLENTGK
jgi:metallo-beta-lactamase class B